MREDEDYFSNGSKVPRSTKLKGLLQEFNLFGTLLSSPSVHMVVSIDQTQQLWSYLIN